jgi:carbamoyl-phosphate synthase small subunit
MKLILEDGTVYEGRSFGFPCDVEGEVVFNTGMMGYVETLTDPSYRGQILVCTYPLQGNYGVPRPDDSGGLSWPFESDHIQVSGLVVVRYSPQHSHHAAEQSLGSWLQREGVPAIEGIDTRALTRRLREKGTMRGRLVGGESGGGEQFSRSLTACPTKPEGRSGVTARGGNTDCLVGSVTCAAVTRYGTGNGQFTVALVDCGAKRNILRSLLQRGLDVVVVPFDHDLPAMAGEVDGFFLSNGPGDPKNVPELIENVRSLLTLGTPVFGICLGHQILALAAGADTFKLPYGHRSQNQPVQDLFTRRCYVTSQNHGYAVVEESLPAGFEPWFVNINDQTNEGIRCLTGPFASVQFHPEASPGPVDTGFLFDEFIRLLTQTRSIHDR